MFLDLIKHTGDIIISALSYCDIEPYICCNFVLYFAGSWFLPCGLFLQEFAVQLEILENLLPQYLQ